MNSQGMQTPPMMIPSQGMQVPPMVIASQGMQTNPVVMTTQGIQAATVAMPSQRIPLPINIQNTPRGQMMMGPPRPPLLHEQGGMPLRPMMPPGVMGQQRQQGIMMAPRGIPH